MNLTFGNIYDLISKVINKIMNKIIYSMLIVVICFSMEGENKNLGKTKAPHDHSSKSPSKKMAKFERVQKFLGDGKSMLLNVVNSGFQKVNSKLHTLKKTIDNKKKNISDSLLEKSRELVEKAKKDGSALKKEAEDLKKEAECLKKESQDYLKKKFNNFLEKANSSKDEFIKKADETVDKAIAKSITMYEKSLKGVTSLSALAWDKVKSGVSKAFKWSIKEIVSLLLIIHNLDRTDAETQKNSTGRSFSLFGAVKSGVTEVFNALKREVDKLLKDKPPAGNAEAQKNNRADKSNDKLPASNAQIQKNDELPRGGFHSILNNIQLPGGLRDCFKNKINGSGILGSFTNKSPKK